MGYDQNAHFVLHHQRNIHLNFRLHKTCELRSMFAIEYISYGSLQILNVEN